MQAGHSPATHSHRGRADPHYPWGTHLAAPVFHGQPGAGQASDTSPRFPWNCFLETDHVPHAGPAGSPPRRTYPQSWTNLWKTSLVAAVNPQSCAHRWTSHEAHGDQDVDTPRGPKTRRGEGPEAGAGVPLLTEPDLI